MEIVFIKQILEIQYGITNEIVGLYPFGSVVYETQTEKSDYDFVVIIDKDGYEYIQFESKDLDLHIMTIDHYKVLLHKHDLMALETFFNPKPIIQFEPEFKNQFRVDNYKLRHIISAAASNSWVKAKKKIMWEKEDTWTGYKSLFHSLRILGFGRQLAALGNIDTFTYKNAYWNRILHMVENGYTPDEILTHFKPIYNQMATEFRKYAPKR